MENKIDDNYEVMDTEGSNTIGINSVSKNTIGSNTTVFGA